MMWSYPILTLSLSISFLIISIIASERSSYFKLRQLNGSIALSTVFFLGGYLTKIHHHTYDDSHYKNLEARSQGFSGIILNPPSERTKYYRYDFDLEQVISNDSIITTSGKIHLYIRKDSISKPYRMGDRLIVARRFFSISKPSNPGEFNYQEYLSRQQIHAHAFVTGKDVLVVGKVESNLLKSLAFSIRDYSSEVINRNISDKRENSIAKALILGIKDHLDNDIKKAYSAAGAMHVLAVSGLHVGIIFLIIKLLFGKLKSSGNLGRYLFGLISISIIWLYAGITGLSPSVLRAATMFSFVALGEVYSREGNIYNSLGLAAFILLLFDPYLIYSVGFQLSFAAVIGIVYLQPKIYIIFDFKWILLDKAWAISCVSIAAQIATFPLTAYYFHQFPTYFLISNLVIIPSAFLMLVGGICMLILDPISHLISSYLGSALERFMWIINELISYIETLPNSLIDWIFLDQKGLIILYGVFITLIVGLHYQVFKTVVFSSLLSLTFLISNWLGYFSQSKKNELVFYNIRKRIAIDHIQGLEATLYVDTISEKQKEILSFQINPNRLQSRLSPIEKSMKSFNQAGFSSKDVISQGIIGSQKIIIIDSTTFHLHFINKIETDIVIINNGAVKNLSWLIEKFDTDQIILGPRNSIYYIMKMKKQATELNLEVHAIQVDGAIRFPL